VYVFLLHAQVKNKPSPDNSIPNTEHAMISNATKRNIDIAGITKPTLAGLCSLAQLTTKRQATVRRARAADELVLHEEPSVMRKAFSPSVEASSNCLDIEPEITDTHATVA